MIWIRQDFIKKKNDEQNGMQKVGGGRSNSFLLNKKNDKLVRR